MKTFFFFFFLESTCALCPWPWPRAFLSLASRVSVLGKAVLGLGLGFFCVLGLEPCVLDSTSAKYYYVFEEMASLFIYKFDLLRGVFRGGGHWAMAIARIAKLHSKVSKIEAWPPPL